MVPLVVYSSLYTSFDLLNYSNGLLFANNWLGRSILIYDNYSVNQLLEAFKIICKYHHTHLCEYVFEINVEKQRR